MSRSNAIFPPNVQVLDRATEQDHVPDDEHDIVLICERGECHAILEKIGQRLDARAPHGHDTHPVALDLGYPDAFDIRPVLEQERLDPLHQLVAREQTFVGHLIATIESATTYFKNENRSFRVTWIFDTPRQIRFIMEWMR